ncbi:hypothetical protein ACE10Z_12675 [Bradyrhizobium sp. Pha-3]|uniref:hypothetical protein n=1 Tax=Bradyrhizobium sp. Pha-3 TaxID=208375 RepID=UPI0035D4C25A
MWQNLRIGETFCIRDCPGAGEAANAIAKTDASNCLLQLLQPKIVCDLLGRRFSRPLFAAHYPQRIVVQTTR